MKDRVEGALGSLEAERLWEGVRFSWMRPVRSLVGLGFWKVMDRVEDAVVSVLAERTVGGG